MSPRSKTVDTVAEALRACAESRSAVAGPFGERLESSIDATSRAALVALGEELGSNSKAIREIFQKGCGALLAEREGRA